MTGGFRVREQKFICGMNYATAPSMQVDFFEVTEQQHKASTRKKKELATSIAKESYNLRKSGRYLELLANRNFRPGDYSVTYTYNEEHHPAPGDLQRADRDFPMPSKHCTVSATKTESNTRSGLWFRNTARWTGTSRWAVTIIMLSCPTRRG